MEIWSELYNLPQESMHFLDSDDFSEKLERPLDLRIIYENLEDGSYNDIWDFAYDVWLMFENAKSFRKSMKVYADYTKVG